jgi:hypothetical protein
MRSHFCLCSAHIGSTWCHVTTKVGLRSKFMHVFPPGSQIRRNRGKLKINTTSMLYVCRKWSSKNQRVFPCLQYEVMNTELYYSYLIWWTLARLYSVEFCHNAHPNSLIKWTASQQALLKIKNKNVKFAGLRNGHCLCTLSGLQSMLEMGWEAMVMFWRRDTDPTTPIFTPLSSSFSLRSG